MVGVSEQPLFLETYPVRFWDFRYAITTGPYPEGRILQLCLTKHGARFALRKYKRRRLIAPDPTHVEAIY